MTTRTSIGAASFLLLTLVSAPPVRAQSPQTTPRPAPAPARPLTPVPAGPAFTSQIFGEIGYTSFLGAADSFDAVLGSSGGLTWGGGVQVAHRSGFFFQFNASYFAADGERVFVSDGEVFPLGIPVDVTVTPLEFTGGYRFVPKRTRTAVPASPRRPQKPAYQPADPATGPIKPPVTPSSPRQAAQAPRAQPPLARVVPYLGGGVGIVLYEEKSDFAESGDNVSESSPSYHVLGGVDFALSRAFVLGVEGVYRWVPDALGEGGASEAFGETDLGGFVFRAKFAFTF